MKVYSRSCGLIAILLSSFLLLNGCSVASIKPHTPHFKTTQKLKDKKPSYRVAGVAAFNAEEQSTLSQNYMLCRARSFYFPKDKSVLQYIEDALRDEFDAAGKLDAKNGQSVAVVVRELSLNSLNGIWTVHFDYKVADKQYEVKTTHDGESAFGGETACRIMSESLTEALSENFSRFFQRL